MTRRARAPGSPAALGVAAAIAVSISACASLPPPQPQPWGAEASIAPGWSRVGRAAWQAVRQPDFWAPLAAAGVTQIDGWDRRISGWARRHHPIYGSQANAERWSNDLRSASVVAGWGSILAADSGPLGSDWLLDKVKGSAVDVAAAEAAIEFTAGLKRLTRRERPNGLDDQSMPSDHTATSAVYAMLATDNLRWSGLPPAATMAADAGLGALTVATGWARIEAGAHFPSDTLVGAAIGNFFANFATTAFLAPASAGAARLQVSTLPGGVQLQLQVSF